MLLPGAPLDTLLLRRALGLITPLLPGLLLVLVLPLLLLSMLLLLVLVLPLLLLSMLLLLVLVLPLLLLSMLLLFVLILPLLLLLLSVLLFGLGLLMLALLLLGMVLLLAALLLLLCVSGSSGCEGQRQDCGADNSNKFHRCCLHYRTLRNACSTASFLSSR